MIIDSPAGATTLMSVLALVSDVLEFAGQPSVKIRLSLIDSQKELPFFFTNMSLIFFCSLKTKETTSKRNVLYLAKNFLTSNACSFLNF